MKSRSRSRSWVDNINRKLSLFLIAILFLTTISRPVSANAEEVNVEEVNAEDVNVEEVNAEEINSEVITVTASLQLCNEFALEEQAFTLSGNEAEVYGYSDEENCITVLDALVAVHKQLLGDDFTTETANNYLSISNNCIERMYGIETTAVSFAVNGYAPHNGIYNEVWQSYTGYMITKAPLSNGDNVEFFFYQDTYYLDNYTYFTQNGKKVREITAETDIPITLLLKGYNYCYYSCSKPEFIEQMTQPVVGAQILQKGSEPNSSFEEQEGVFTQDSEDGDEMTDGAFTITFQTPGTYYLSAKTNVDDYEIPIVSPYCKVVVTQGNRIPSIKEGVETDLKKDLVVNQSFSIDLSMLFEDADDDSLIYYMSEDNGAYERVWGNQSIYKPKTAGKHTVKFKAYDGKVYSTIVKYNFYVDEQSEISIEPTTDTANVIYQSPSVSSYHDYIWNSKEGNILQFSATSSNEEEVLTWSCTEGRGIIDKDGTLTLVRPTTENTVIITVTGEDKISKKEYYLNIKPDGIDFGQDSISIALSEDGTDASRKFDMANNYYSGNIVIKSSDSAVADVTIKNNTYTVTPKKPGNVTLTASWEADSSVQDTIHLKVTGVGIFQKGKFNDGIIQLGKGNDSIELTAIGEDEAESFTWSSSNTDVATVDQDGKVIGHKEGATIITAVSSTSTPQNTIRGSRKIQVKNCNMHYIESLKLGSYTSFGLTDESSFFSSSVREYQLKANNSNVSAFTITPEYGEDLGATAYYTDKNGNSIEKDLKSGVSNSLTNALAPGDNNIIISVYPKDSKESRTEYVFHIFRPCTTTATLSSMTLYPNGLTAKTYPTYQGKVEGTLIRTQKGTVGFTSSINEYTAYVFEGTDSITLKTGFGNEFERVCMKVENRNDEIIKTQTTTSDIYLKDQGDTTIQFYVLSSQAYYDAVKNGVKAPFENPEKVYTVVIKRVHADAAEMKIINASLENGSFYAPGFKSDNFAQNILLPAKFVTTNLIFTVPKGVLVYKTSVVDENQLTQSKQQETNLGLEGTGKQQETSQYVCGLEKGKTLKLCLKDPETGVVYSYSFNCNTKGPDDIMPDEITEYLCMASQYTNSAAYGMNPERTLVAANNLGDAVGGSVLSLGNYGGYIVYKYNTPILNNNRNPYGIDFMVYGNCNPGQSFAEPGNVEVSADGLKWYSLAGSMHYEDEAFWNYKVTYTKNVSGGCDWSDNIGGKGTLRFAYPVKENYPLYNRYSENKNSITLEGVKLVDDLDHIYDGEVGAYPDWGYTDTHKNESVMGQAGNPYLGDEKAGSAFDLSWAVDENGQPVKLDAVSYIRVSTASFIDAGMFGEKSTEIQTIARTVNVSETAVGKTAMPSAIKVDGKDVPLKEGVYSYDVKYMDDFNVAVDADENTNIYINNERTSNRNYDTAPKHGMIRILLQEGEKEPVIYYLTLKADKDQIEANKVISMIDAIASVSIENAGLIYDARKAYNALSVSGKKLVTNYSALTIAEEELEKLMLVNKPEEPPASVKPPEVDGPPISDLPDNHDGGNEEDDTKQLIQNLSAPSIKGESISYNKLQICWNKIEHARGYYIYRSTDRIEKNFKLIAILEDETSFKDTKLICGQKYYYKVKAFTFNNSGMVMSEVSNTVSLKVIPSTTEINKLSTKKKTCSLKWSKIEGVSGYQVFRSNSLKGSYKLVKTTRGTSFKDKKIKEKTVYYYKVRAYRMVKGKKIYGELSEVKKIKVK